jgi:hypothetical protein
MQNYFIEFTANGNKKDTVILAKSKEDATEVFTCCFFAKTLTITAIYAETELQ